MTENDIQSHADTIRTVDYTVLKNEIPKDVVATLLDAFWPLYESHLETIKNDPNRGPCAITSCFRSKSHFISPHCTPTQTSSRSSERS
jgi:hypothetical protein